MAFGVIPQVLALGKDSCATMDLLLSSRRELQDCERNRTGTNQISTLILLDRSVDPVSPLLTPSTYNALLDAKLDAKWNKVTLPTEGENEKPKTIHLSHDVSMVMNCRILSKLEPQIFGLHHTLNPFRPSRSL